jgi:hypothetical protein
MRDSASLGGSALVDFLFHLLDLVTEQFRHPAVVGCPICTLLAGAVGPFPCPIRERNVPAVRVAWLSTVILQYAFRTTVYTVARDSVGFSTVAARISSVVTGSRSTGLYTSIRISFIITAALGW